VTPHEQLNPGNMASCNRGDQADCVDLARRTAVAGDPYPNAPEDSVEAVMESSRGAARPSSLVTDRPVELADVPPGAERLQVLLHQGVGS